MSKTFGQSTRSSMSVKFHKKGSTFTGVLLELPIEVQATDIDSGKPAFWDAEGKRPKMQWVFSFLKVNETVCDCEQYCDEGEKNAAYGAEDDDGVRKMYVGSSNQIKAIAKAIRDAGVKGGDPEIGSTLVIKYTAPDKDKQKPGKAAPKLYAAAYKRPTPETLAMVAEVNGATEADDEDVLADVDDDLWAAVGGKSVKPDNEARTASISTGGSLSFEDMASIGSGE